MSFPFYFVHLCRVRDLKLISQLYSCSTGVEHATLPDYVATFTLVYDPYRKVVVCICETVLAQLPNTDFVTLLNLVLRFVRFDPQKTVCDCFERFMTS